MALGIAGPAGTASGQPRPNAACQECGRAGPAMPGGFCCHRCRAAFNNRRAKRGAELYDLFMALRFDRRAATTLKLWRIVNRMASRWRSEDVTARAGRASWRPPSDVLARRPSLRATVVYAPMRAIRLSVENDAEACR